MDLSSPDALTPVEMRNGLWYKREDLHRGPWGVNGAKYRACRHLVRRACDNGANHLISAASVLSPQSAMGSVLAREYNMACTVIVGGTTPDKAIKHRSIQIASEAGADIRAIGVGYNPALQAAARKFVSENENAWRLPYGITEESDRREDIEAFLRVGAPQTMNLPDNIETLILPFGSGNTSAGILYGLHDFRPANLKRIVLMGIGPDRQTWLKDRLSAVERSEVPAGVQLQHIPLHPLFATYGDRMNETQDGITFHPTYEGKVVRFLNYAKPDWWVARDERTCLWIVGGPVAA